jgi:hypothetical protein
MSIRLVCMGEQCSRLNERRKLFYESFFYNVSVLLSLQFTISLTFRQTHVRSPLVLFSVLF